MQQTDAIYQHYLTIALAQPSILDGQVSSNLHSHLDYIAAAASHRCDLVVFPELSLTGYLLEHAASLALNLQSPEVEQLKQAATRHQLVVLAGGFFDCGGDKPVIGTLICRPCGHVDLYAKQHLHPGEALFCQPGKDHFTLAIKDVHIALAVCADFTEPKHPQHAINVATDLYLASALISPQGYGVDSALLAGIAKQYQLPVLLSNHISKTGGWQGCGQSGFWLANGESQQASQEAGMMLCYFTSQGMHGQEMGLLA
ncbi:Glutamine-dependent NAD(+) synthetase [Vibrio stylophorae]|uniref:Glutamine-dependent NAD(+) synthetase n=1 Tax=Vibrio stylophorae TaxID=659351 RepID=A0ABM8ZXD9_9VIBR|nr:carbon-nitrogen hydrolase family protein [Vibrio stylophorae]CAH0535270.1 Glutamine-dependent NAD(+) synthetase [Vibrio stylophorae]